MFVKETLYTLNDIAVIPAATSDISSRSECNPYYDDTKMLPVFVSPMNNIIDDNNFQPFLDAGVNVITPRDNENTPYSERRERWEQLWKRGIFVALSLREFEQFFIEFKDYTEPDFNITYTRRVCVDLANGHMKRLLDACKQVKKSFGNKVIIMTGNIANPDTYKDYAKAGIDYVRCGIGTGSICFVDGTKVTMADGTKKNIEDIQVNEKVLTHAGIGTVDERFRYKTNKETVTINNEITCTTNHEFYVINKCDKDEVNENNLHDFAYWIAAKDLDKDTHLLIKKYS